MNVWLRSIYLLWSDYPGSCDRSELFTRGNIIVYFRLSSLILSLKQKLKNVCCQSQIVYKYWSLSTFASWYRDAVLDNVWLDASKIKDWKSLRLSKTNNSLQWIPTRNKHTNFTISLEVSDENVFDRFLYNF